MKLHGKRCCCPYCLERNIAGSTERHMAQGCALVASPPRVQRTAALDSSSTQGVSSLNSEARSFRSLSPAPSQAVCSSCSRDQSSRVAPVTGLALAMLLTGLALAALVMGGAGGRLDEAAMSEASSNDVHTSQAKAAECKALDVQARSSVTGLHSAASRGDVEGIKVLLVDCEEGCLERRIEDGLTPLHSAARAGHADAIEVLADAGASLEARADGKRTALHLAASGGHSKAVKALVAAGASLQARAEYGLTPLHAAASTGQTKAIKALVAAGASLEAQAMKGITPLHSAAAHGQEEAIYVLVIAGASLRARGERGVTPLHLAAAGGQSKTIEALVAIGAPLEAQGDYGWTPLHVAATTGQAEAIRALLAAGASLEAQAVHGVTPLLMATAKGHSEAIKALKSAGTPSSEASVQSIGALTAVLTIIFCIIVGRALTRTKEHKPAATSRRRLALEKAPTERKGPAPAEQQTRQRKVAAVLLPEQAEVSLGPRHVPDCSELCECAHATACSARQADRQATERKEAAQLAQTARELEKETEATRLRATLEAKRREENAAAARRRLDERALRKDEERAAAAAAAEQQRQQAEEVARAAAEEQRQRTDERKRTQAKRKAEREAEAARRRLEKATVAKPAARERVHLADRTNTRAHRVPARGSSLGDVVDAAMRCDSRLARAVGQVAADPLPTVVAMVGSDGGAVTAAAADGVTVVMGEPATRVFGTE